MAERCKARVCDRSLAEVAVSIPIGGMDVCVVCCTTRKKRQSRDNQDKEVQIKYRQPKEISVGKDSSYTAEPALGPTQPPIKWVLRVFSVGKAAGAWR